MRFTWLGHNCWQITLADRTLLVDPFLDDSPTAPVKSAEVACDEMLVSHGHFDHIGDAAAIAQRTGARVYANFEVGVYTCYDRHFPEGARCLGLAGAEIVFNPSATVAGLSEYLWRLEQPAHAVANQYFVGAINRPGWEDPWRIGEFYGQSYFVDPRGQFIAQSSKRTEDDIVLADMDLEMIREVRNTWQFFRDRRPETYGPLVEL